MSDSKEELEEDRKTEYIEEGCTGFYWKDEYGTEAFIHHEYIYCPIHDLKKI